MKNNNTPKSKVITSTNKKQRPRWVVPTAFVAVFLVLGVAGAFIASASTKSYSLWPDTSVPKTISYNDSNAVELGMKFKTTTAGQVTGIQFYKGPQNSGTHVGSLWDSKGARLAIVTFKNETSTGWQTATLSQPVSIAANVTYVVSYYAPQGHYADNQYYFNHSRLAGPMIAQAASGTSGNGVYAYGSSSLFPNNSSLHADNYWVDVIFANPLINPTPKPAPPLNTKAVQNGSSVRVTWDASISAKTITKYLLMRNGSQIASLNGSALSYTDNAVSAGKTYSYQLQAVDSANVTSSMSTIASVTYNTVPVPTPTPTPKPVPTPTPRPTPTPTPTTPVSSQGTNCVARPSVCGFPDATNTGVQAGVNLASSGSITVNTNGAVIQNLNITGCIDIEADNVTIKNVRVTCSDYFAIQNYKGHTNLTVMDSEIIGTSTKVSSGIIGSNFTALRVNIHGTADGIDGDSNVTVQDSYVHDLAAGADTHNDDYQNTGSANTVLRHNTFFNKHSAASCIMFGSENGSPSTILVTNNLLDGGNYTIYLDSKGTNRTVTNNHIGRDLVYGSYNMNGSFTATGNVWDDSGAANNP